MLLAAKTDELTDQPAYGSKTERRRAPSLRGL